MTDPNLKNFYTRVARIERAHANGFGHEALGTLGRSLHIRPRKKGVPLLRGSVFLMAALIGMKATIYGGLGEEAYLSRLALLKQGTALERTGAWLMTPDPVSEWLADIWRQVNEG